MTITITRTATTITTATTVSTRTITITSSITISVYSRATSSSLEPQFVCKQTGRVWIFKLDFKFWRHSCWENWLRVQVLIILAKPLPMVALVPSLSSSKFMRAVQLELLRAFRIETANVNPTLLCNVNVQSPQVLGYWTHSAYQLVFYRSNPDYWRVSFRARFTTADLLADRSVDWSTRNRLEID